MNKVLIIDDEVGITELISDILLAEGFEPHIANNGADGIRLIKEINPDVILSDLNLPLFDGFQILAEVRSHPETFTTPFILISARSQSNDVRNAMQLGADDYLSKPFSNTALVETIKAQLLKKQQTKKVFEEQNQQFRKSVLKSIPHEFRTPLNGILGFCQLINMEVDSLKVDEEEKNEIKSMTKLVYESGHRLLNMVQNYIFYLNLQELFDAYLISPLEESEHECSIQYALHDIAVKVADKYHRQSDLKLELNADSHFKFDPTNLDKLLEELVDNAFKFSSAGNIVKVTTFFDNNKGYCIEIFNEGIGLSKNQMENISALRQFERDKMEQQGIGLGLAIVKIISEIYKIKLEFSGEKDKHATVLINFPF